MLVVYTREARVSLRTALLSSESASLDLKKLQGDLPFEQEGRTKSSRASTLALTKKPTAHVGTCFPVNISPNQSTKFVPFAITD